MGTNRKKNLVVAVGNVLVTWTMLIILFGTLQAAKGFMVGLFWTAIFIVPYSIVYTLFFVLVFLFFAIVLDFISVLLGIKKKPAAFIFDWKQFWRLLDD